MGSAGDWERTAGALSQGFFCIVPDLPGHGESAGLPEESYTIEGTAKAVMSLIDKLGVEKARLVGYSMGGRLALYLALRYPDRCAGVLLESASPGIESPEERDARRCADEEKAECLELGDFEEFLRDWYRQPIFASLSRHEGLVEKLVRSRMNNDPRELARSLRGMGTGSQPSLWDELSDLKTPVLAVVGELDEKFVRISRQIAEQNPHIRVRSVPGAGHNVRLEAPGAYLSLLEGFASSRAG